MRLPQPSSLLAGLFTIVLSIPTMAHAKEDVSTTVQFSLGNFEPNIGASSAQDYHNATFEESSLEKTIVFTKYLPGELIQRDIGQLGLRVQLGQWKVSNKAASDSEDESASLSVIPLSLGLAYRSDILTERWAVPITAYASTGLASYIWTGAGPFREGDSSEGSSYEASDSATGYYLSLGIGLNLDFLFSQTFNTGAKGYQVASLLVEWHRGWLNNFEDGASSSRMDLSSEQWRFGIAIDL